MSKASFQPLSSFTEYPVEEMKQRAADFRVHMQRRRTVRQFSDRPVPEEIIEGMFADCRDCAQWRQPAALAFCCRDGPSPQA